MISPGFFSFFVILIFWVVKGVKGQKMVQNDKKILSVVLHISGTIHHMIFIYGTHKENGNISAHFFFFLHVFKILIFWVVMGVKGQKIVQNDKEFCLSQALAYEKHMHASSQNSEAVDVRKVARHPPSRRVVACDDYSFYNNIVFSLLQ